MSKDTKPVLPAVLHLFCWKLKHPNSYFSICRNSLASMTSDWSGSLMLPNLSASREAGTCCLSAVRRNRNMGALKLQEARGWLYREYQSPDWTLGQYSPACISLFPSSGRGERYDDMQLSSLCEAWMQP